MFAIGQNMFDIGQIHMFAIGQNMFAFGQKMFAIGQNMFDIGQICLILAKCFTLSRIGS